MPEMVETFLTRAELVALVNLLNVAPAEVEKEAGISPEAGMDLWRRLTARYADEFGSDPNDDATDMIARSGFVLP